MIEDILYDKAEKAVIKNKSASVKFLMKKLNIGYYRAVTMIRQLKFFNVIEKNNEEDKKVLIKK